MEIWFSLLIPVAAILLLLFKFNKKMALWEYPLVFFIPLLVIVSCYFGFKDMNTTAKEVWNSYAVRAYYFEDWDEYIHKTCETCTETCSGSGESRSCNQTCTSYDCSYVDYHPARWEIEDNIGQSFHVSQSYFEFLCSFWKNRTFQNMNRDYHSNDGDLYFSVYPKTFEKTIPLVTRHTYKNKIQASNSVYNFQEVSEAEVKGYGLFKHPEINDRETEVILGYQDKKSSDSLKKFNALFGSAKKIHIQVLVFKNQPVTAAFFQENFWKGGNKNEFTLCIGLKDSLITWTKVISWTENYSLKTETESYILGLGVLNMNRVVNYMGTEVVRGFSKRDFRQFDYITIKVPLYAVMISFFLTLLSTVGISIFVIKNGEDYHG